MNSAPDEHTPRWSLSEEPTLAIGREGDSLYEFNNLGRALSLSDGRIVLTNANQELRFYAPNGEFLLRSGRKGYGPGEFRQLSAILVLPGDSIAALNNHDGAFRELILFDERGRFAREFRTELRGVGLTRLDSGDWIGERVEHARLSCVATPTEVRSEISIVRGPASGSHARQIARILAGFGVMSGCNFSNVPLAPQGSWAVAGGYLFTAEDTAHVIRVRSVESGRVLRTVRTNVPQRRVTSAMIEEVLNPSGLRSSASRREARTVTHPEMRYPNVLPAIASMQTDTDERVWVRRYFLPSDPEHEWWIYEPVGRLIATLTHPARFRITEIGSDYVLGIWRDEDDVQTVRRYALLKIGFAVRSRSRGQ